MQIHFQSANYVKQNLSNNRPKQESKCNINTLKITNNSIKHGYYMPIKNISFTSRAPRDIKDVQQFFESIKNVNAKIWSNGECIMNPAAKENLSFLDDLSIKEKKIVVDEYKIMTGLPNFKTVNKNMSKEAINAINQIAKENQFKTLYAGYNNSCSMGKELALPGSDIDGLVYLIDDKSGANQYYRYLLGTKINQRLLETGADHYPEVIPYLQAKEFINLAEESFSKQKFSDKELKGFDKAIDNFDENYVKAADFNIKIIKNINIDEKIILKMKKDNLPQESIENATKQYKWDFLATCQMLENYRQNKGNTLLNNLDSNTKELFENSCLYKYSNITQQKAIMPYTKDKLLERPKVLKNFDEWSLEKQFDFVKTTIYSSFQIKPSKDNPFYKLFTNSGEHTFGPDSQPKMYELLTKI